MKNKFKLNGFESLKIGDKVIICLILLLTVGTHIYLINTKVIGQSRIITIRVDQELQSFKYNVNATHKIRFNFENHEGVLVFNEGKVKMERMDLAICPKQICSRTGWIQYEHQSIVCLPNKIIITIEVDEEEQVNTISKKLLDNEQEVFL